MSLYDTIENTLKLIHECESTAFLRADFYAADYPIKQLAHMKQLFFLSRLENFSV